MQSSKLLTLISGLDTAEFRWLHKFLKSPFYNTNEKVLRLFEHIKKYYPDLASPKLAKEITFQYLFPKEKFSPQKMRKLMHELATLVEDFMVAQHFQKNKCARKKILAKELGQRNLYDLFEKGITEIAADLEKLPYRDKDYFLERYLNKYQFLSHPLTAKRQNVKERLLPLSEDLDCFYFLQKLKMNCDLESAKNIYCGEGRLPFFEEIAREIKKRNLTSNPAIELYSIANQVFINKNSINAFNNLYQHFLQNKEFLTIEDKDYLLRLLINSAIFKFNGGKEAYLDVCFDLYNIGLKEDLFTRMNRITESVFTNIITISCLLKKFDFADKFIQQYKSYLDKSQRCEIVLLNKANIIFNKGMFSETIDLLLPENFTNNLFKLRAKMLLLKSYYELSLADASYFNLTITRIENFERNIRREENIAEIKKIRHLNFSKFLKKLIISKVKQKDSKKLEGLIETTDMIVSKSWLLEKVAFK